MFLIKKMKSSTKNTTIKESDIQRSILKYLRLKSIFCWKNNTVGIAKPNGHYIPAQMTGIADILGIMPDGRFLAIEVKRPGNKPTPNQVQFIQNIINNKGLAFLAYSLDDVKQIIK